CFRNNLFSAAALLSHRSPGAPTDYFSAKTALPRKILLCPLKDWACPSISIATTVYDRNTPSQEEPRRTRASVPIQLQSWINDISLFLLVERCHDKREARVSLGRCRHKQC
ncbi:Protein of unknown function, partial [Gryllus bimaculatus]